jgi:hypothetical protein
MERSGSQRGITMPGVRCKSARGFTMGPHIDAFCGEICLKLVDIDEELRYLKNTIREKARHRGA